MPGSPDEPLDISLHPRATAQELVVFDRDEREIDRVDPYLGHRVVGSSAHGTSMVVADGRGGHYTVVPAGGRFETRSRG